MRIAIPYSDDGTVFSHFGKAARFKVYDVEDGSVTGASVCETDGTGHDALGLWLLQQGVSAVICGGIGPSAMGVLAVTGIAVCAGAAGNADEVLERYLAGELLPATSPTCGGHAGGCAHAHRGCGGHAHGCGGHAGGCGGCCH